MIYHCGLLDEEPKQSRTLKWIRTARSWNRLPPDVRHELNVFLSMPGFPVPYMVEVFGVSHMCVRRWQTKEAHYDVYQDEVARNWMSTTREDAMALARLRRPGRAFMPLICQVQILQDLKFRKLVDVSRDYQVTQQQIMNWRRTGLTIGSAKLPAGFDWLVS